MHLPILLLNILLGLLLIGLVLLQTKGSGLANSWGAGEHAQSKRGVEKIIYQLTIWVAILFLGLSLLNTFFS